MPVNIHGKQYKTVAERIEESKDSVISISTEVLNLSDNRAVVKATIMLEGKGPYTAISCEFRDDPKSMVNKSSFLENAETSAVGRALSFAGWGGSEIASADEVASAIARKEANDKYKSSYTSSKSDYSPKIKGVENECVECGASCSTYERCHECYKNLNGGSIV